MLDPSDPTVRDAVFGKQVEHFLQSDLGNYLLKRASAEQDAALRKLSKINAHDPAAIETIQLELRVAEKFIDWLGDAVAAGLQATQHIQEDA